MPRLPRSISARKARFDTLFAENVLDVLLDVKNPTFWDGAIKITAFSK
jgi:hypothetical protein